MHGQLCGIPDENANSELGEKLLKPNKRILQNNHLVFFFLFAEQFITVLASK